VAPSVAPTNRWVRTASILCLQSTFMLSVTVADLGFNLSPVCPNRSLSGLVVVRRGGQPDRDRTLRRSSQCAAQLPLSSWRPVSSSSGHHVMSLVSASFWHMAGMRVFAGDRTRAPMQFQTEDDRHETHD
jgi:hypothetical protein